MDIQFDNAALSDHLKGGIEVSNDEIKKQRAQTRRFGYSALKEHSQAGHIKSALKTLEPEQLLKVLNNTCSALSGAGGGNSEERYGAPRLVPPSPKANLMSSAHQEKLSAKAQLTELLAKITHLTGESTVKNLVSRLNAYNAMFEGTTKQFNEMADELLQKGRVLDDKEQALEGEKAKGEPLRKAVSDAQDGLNKARERLNNLQQRDKGTQPDPSPQDPPVIDDLQSVDVQIVQAKSAVEAAENRLNVATEKLNDWEKGPLVKARDAVVQARNDLQNTVEKSNKLVDSVSPAQHSAIEGRREQQGDSTYSLTFLMALMAQLIDKSASEDLDAASQLKQKLAKAAQKDAQQKAKEYEEQVRRAEEAQKTMGCIGKIVGWAVTAIGFAAAAFTGGASLAIAAVGLALALGDEIYQAVTGDSFIQKTMDPIMKSVIQPMMKLFGDMFSSVLEMFGVDKSKAEMVGQIMGAITAAIMMVVGMVVAGALMSKIGGTAIGRVASKVAEQTTQKLSQLMQKVLSSSVRQAVKRVTERFGRQLGLNEVKMAKYANYAMQGSTVAEFANVTAASGVNIYTADLLVEASRAQAKISRDVALLDLLNQLLDQSIERFNNRIATANQIFKNIASIAEHQLKSSHYIAHQMRTKAS
ncbi:type III secretion system translocon subunit SctE [Pantoea sp. AMG 501]|uniref:type III secretion system translocon subunit SctE n=1 Tax=Pantoea sp. AMG 501 TaxID=2008894 RepID=UPI000B5A2807|nr:type III secretion system translocon subunit SctE [Pantoea sp. AMG 501]OWY74576.1 type III secretion system protein [Pantoea sp. AMG 501]